MDKKSYLIIGATILVFVIAIIVILLSSGNKKDLWTEIQQAQKYEITMTDCNSREKVLKETVLTILSSNWSNLSNNGPWTGNNSICYNTLTVSYENNGIINSVEILLIDNSSLALNTSNSNIYYTNAEDIISQLNTLFIE